MISVERGNTRGWPKTRQQLDWALLKVNKNLTTHAAALKAGFSEKHAKRNGWKLERDMAPFLAFLQERKSRLLERRYDATNERIVKGIAAIALSNPADYVTPIIRNKKPYLIGRPIDELEEFAALAVQSWEIVEIKDDQGEVHHDYQYVLYDRRGSLIDLGKHRGMFNEKLLLELRHRSMAQDQTDYTKLSNEDLQEKIDDFQRILEEIRNPPIEVTPESVDLAEESD